MTEPENDTPGVLLPPPVIFAGALAAGIILDLVAPRPFAPDWLRFSLGPVLIAGAGGLAGIAGLAFRRAGTAARPWRPTTAIVTTGAYRFTRNPIYLALAMLLAAAGLLYDSLWLMATLIGFVGVIHRGVILREEAYLERKFGERYRAYKQGVRRWL